MAPRDYGSLNGGEQVPLIPMHIIDSIDEKSSSTKGDSHCQSLAKKLAFYGSLTTAAVLLTTWLGFFHGTAPLDPAPPYAPTQHAHHAHHAHHAQLSSLLLSPIDMGVPSVDRSDDRLPGNVWGTKLLEDPKTGFKKPLPTNVWYLNLLSRNAGTRSTVANKVYTVPYIIDTVGPITGMRLHWPIAQASDRNIQMVYDASNGLTMGTTDPNIGKQYYLDYYDDQKDLSFLGLSLTWGGGGSSGGGGGGSGGNNNNKSNNKRSMTSHIVRGMAYATMKYEGGTLPSFVTGHLPVTQPLIDGTTHLKCGQILDNDDDDQLLYSKQQQHSTVESVQREVQIHLKDSDFTWIIFFSRPVKLECFVAPKIEGPGVAPKPTMFQMNVVDYYDEHHDHEPLVVRAAMLNQCTTGKSDMHVHCKKDHKWKDQAAYLKALRDSAHLYSANPVVDLDLSSGSSSEDTSRVTFDWDVQIMTGGSSTTGQSGGGGGTRNKGSDQELLMFALPHHQSILEPIEGTSTNTVTEHCIPTFHGNTCLVKGSKWSLVEELGSPQSFIANRPPEASAIPDLARALAKDIQYTLSDNLKRGAIDTYFSGKILARVGRVILIASELNKLASSSKNNNNGMNDYLEDDPDRYSSTAEACKNADLPSDDEITDAVDRLRLGVEIWLSGEAEAPFVYDKSWGGLVNCGCDYTAQDDHGVCANSFPDCPALWDVNVDFGNGFYNDHHFHYGYHIYAAAVVAKYDQEWGRKFFDRVMLYIRDIANPFADDAFFPQYRHKDWFLGSSWASGFISADTPHGRNQESSSEAIAAYEAVTLFGDVMADAFDAEDGSTAGAETAKQVRDAGRLLTAMEVKATQRYWHVWNSSTHNNTYPAAYKEPVVGMMYETMASFQTWFAGGDIASFGIQLLPFTPVSERRDDPEWAAKLYPAFNQTCSSHESFCVMSGWSIALSGLLATTGKREEASDTAQSIPEIVFNSSGGNGHSLSNTLWYISTRPDVELNPLTTGENSTGTAI